MNERLLLQIIRVVPKNIVSRWMGRLTSVPLPRGLRPHVHSWYARRYGVCVDEAEFELVDYPSLHDFFTRTLKPGMRPIGQETQDSILSPADGRISSCGRVDGSRLFQVKGRCYDLGRLLQDPDIEPLLSNGSYATVYLSPSDYHRVHFPVGGEITGFRYIPGTLFPVNDLGVRHIEELFAINERLVTYVRTEAFGRVAVVMIGAMGVGKITVSYDPVETNRPGRREQQRVVYPQPLPCRTGDELGVFHLGSTVVVLCEKPGMIPALPEGSRLRMGQALLVPGPTTAVRD